MGILVIDEYHDTKEIYYDTTLEEVKTDILESLELTCYELAMNELDEESTIEEYTDFIFENRKQYIKFKIIK